MEKNLNRNFIRVQGAGALIDRVRRRAGHLQKKFPWNLTGFQPKLSFLAFLLIGLSMSLAIAACSPVAKETTTAPKADVELKLVSFSVTKAAYDRIIPKFVEKWRQEHGQTVGFQQSYGASATQALLVVEGREEADVVHLSLAPDVTKIEEAGLITAGWQEEFPDESIVTRSVVAIVTREGNPKGISTWNDLAKPEIQVITPNPFTSGGGRWNFLALWNAAKQSGADEAKTLDFLTRVYKNAPNLPGSARQATLDFFQQNRGDVLLTYENEVILKESKGQKLSYRVPDVNFSIDNPVAVVDKNADHHKTREVAEAFVRYLYSPEAQEEFAKIGYRSVDPNVAPRYPAVSSLATVKDYGGWQKIRQEFFDSGALISRVFRSVSAAT